jgi:hypothetical protein
MPRRYIQQLDSVEMVRRELRRVYRSLKCEGLDPRRGMAMVATLREIRACIESIEIETRIRMLEARTISESPSLLQPPINVINHDVSVRTPADEAP